MGIHRHAYLGPVIKVKAEKEEVITNYSACSNDLCSYRKQTLKSPFCPQCGAKETRRSKRKLRDKIDFSTLLNETLEESLSQVFTPSEIIFGGYVYIIPNENRNAPRNFKITNDEFSFTPAFNQTAEINWLETNFQKEIEQIKSLAGNAEVEVTWGLITYSN